MSRRALWVPVGTSLRAPGRPHPPTVVSPPHLDGLACVFHGGSSYNRIKFRPLQGQQQVHSTYYKFILVDVSEIFYFFFCSGAGQREEASEEVAGF